jgi:zinc protease
VLARLGNAYGRYRGTGAQRSATPAPLAIAGGASMIAGGAKESHIEVKRWTPTAKILIGYPAPELTAPDHLPLSLLAEVLAGGSAARLTRALVRDAELAADVRASVSPLRDPGLFEFSLAARPGVSAEQLLTAFDEQLAAFLVEGPQVDELERGRARLELEQLSGLVSCDGRASSVGFYALMTGDPAGGYQRLRALAGLALDDVRHAAERWLTVPRTIICAPARSTPVEEQDD